MQCQLEQAPFKNELDIIECEFDQGALSSASPQALQHVLRLALYSCDGRDPPEPPNPQNN
eukprot:3733269-Amphidinium_carterae.1